jgi:hypothetical protein
MNKIINGPFPKIYQYLTDDHYNMLEMELLGPSLEKAVNKQPFSKNIR